MIELNYGEERAGIELGMCGLGFRATHATPQPPSPRSFLNMLFTVHIYIYMYTVLYSYIHVPSCEYPAKRAMSKVQRCLEPTPKA